MRGKGKSMPWHPMLDPWYVYIIVTHTLQNQSDGRNSFVRNLKPPEGQLIPFDAHLFMKT